MIVSLFLVAGAFLTLFNFIQPAYDDVQKLKSEVRVREEFVSAQQEAVKRVQGLISKYNNQTELWEVFSLTLPFEKDVSGALTQLAGLVQNTTLGASGFSISGAAVSSEAGKSRNTQGEAVDLSRPLGNLQFQFSFTGSYDNSKNFLEKLEHNIRVFNVSSLSLSPAGKSNQDLYRVDMQAETYYQKN